MTRETTGCDHMAHDRKGQNSSYSAPLSSGMDRWAIAMAISLSALTVMLLALATQASSWAKPPGSEGAASSAVPCVTNFLWLAGRNHRLDGADVVKLERSRRRRSLEVNLAMRS
jgi:hypothetical protein